MARRTTSLWVDHRFLVELFALINIGGLTADIYLAHSMNLFRERAEYIPLIVSLTAPVLLIAGAWCYSRGSMRAWAFLGHVAGWTCILVGIAGAMYHLESSFFQARTLSSLVYSAPFAAPLAYTGLGLLLVMNRMVAPDDPEWAYWVLLLALGGYLGNFIFSVTDHAQNGFYYRIEWVAVITGAFGVGFLFIPFVRRVTRPYILCCAAVMVVGAVVGVVGCGLHVAADLGASEPSLFGRVVYGAPVFAPLLFVDMAVLALIGLGVLFTQTPPVPSGRADGKVPPATTRARS